MPVMVRCDEGAWKLAARTLVFHSAVLQSFDLRVFQVAITMFLMVCLALNRHFREGSNIRRIMAITLYSKSRLLNIRMPFGFLT